MYLDDYTVVSLDQDLPTFGATCALLRRYLHLGPQRLVLHIRHMPLNGEWKMENGECPEEDPIAMPQHHIIMAMN